MNHIGKRINSVYIYIFRYANSEQFYSIMSHFRIFQLQ